MKAIRLLCILGLCILLFPGCGKKDEQPGLATDSVAAPAPDPKGTKIESQEGKFGIVLPEDFPHPETSTKQVPTDIGEITMHLYTASAADGSTFIVSYNDYPESAFVKEIDMMMDDIRDGALANMSAKLEGQRDFTFQGSPARSIDFSVPSEGAMGYGRMQYFIMKPRLYQLLYLSFAADNREDERIKQSFASFRLLP